MGGQEGTGLGDGCHDAGRAVHGALDQCHVSRMWNPNRLENHSCHARGPMASALGRVARSPGRGRAVGLEGDPDG